MRRLLLLLLLINSAFAITCTVDNTGHTGTCIDDTFSFFNKDIFKGCDYSPYYDDGSVWLGYIPCTATIRFGSTVSDAGSLVADVWSSNANQLIECAGYPGSACDVNPSNGFSVTGGDAGVCDSSSANCVRCDVNHLEVKSWTGGPLIIGDGNGLCEADCGASIECDEKRVGFLSENSGCNSFCEYLFCDAFAWDNESDSCYTYCDSRAQCSSNALCLNNVCVNDFQAPNYDIIGFEDLTPTPDGSLITGDFVKVFVHWVDNYNIKQAILLTSSDEVSWINSGLINYELPDNAWSNFTITANSGVNYWKVIVTDLVGNTRETSVQSFTAYDASASFSVTNHLSFDSILLFSGWVTPEANKPADNSFLSSVVGDFSLKHTGIGTRTRYGFKLNTSLPNGIIIKLSNEYPLTDYSASKLINLKPDSITYPDWCQSNLPGDVCNVWVYMDLAGGFAPMKLSNKIIIYSEDVS